MSDPLLDRLNLAPGRELRRTVAMAPSQDKDVWEYDIVAPDGEVEGRVRFECACGCSASAGEHFQRFDCVGRLVDEQHW